MPAFKPYFIQAIALLPVAAFKPYFVQAIA